MEIIGRPASKQIYLLTGDVAGDDREQEQADHLKDNREAEYRVQVSSQTNFLEVINRECLEQLRCQIEGQQQTDERNQLVVLDDDAECFLETGLGSSCAGGRLFLDVEYGDADANDENNDDADGNGGEAGFRDVDEGTVCLLLHNGVVAELVVEEIDGAQTKCAHNEAAQRCKDTRNDGNAFALLRIRGQVRQPRPIRNIHNGVGHAVQYVHTDT